MNEAAAQPTPPPTRRARGTSPFLIGVVGGLFVSALVIVPTALAAFRRQAFGPEGFDQAFPGPILPLLVLAGLIWLATWIAPRFRRGDPALALIRERYARGEINDADYERLKKGLHNGSR